MNWTPKLLHCSHTNGLHFNQFVRNAQGLSDNLRMHGARTLSDFRTASGNANSTRCEFEARLRTQVALAGAGKSCAVIEQRESDGFVRSFPLRAFLFVFR